MLGRLETYMKQDISSVVVPMSFPSTLVTHGYGTVFGLVVVHMGAFVILILIQVQPLFYLCFFVDLDFNSLN